MSTNVNAGVVAQLTVAWISLACSLFTVIIIYSIGKWNGYILMIVSLSVSQALYDISIVMYPCYDNCYITREFLRYFAGLEATFWTNVILTVVAYIVVNLRTFNVQLYYWRIFSGLLLVSTLVTFSNYYYSYLRIYFWLRIISIAYNILIYIFVKHRLQSTTEPTTDWSIQGILIKFIKLFTHSLTPEAIKRDPVHLLTRRLKYYPIVQVICRIGVSLYEFSTNTNGFEYVYTPTASTWDNIVFFVYAITQPAAGIGFFLIFLYVTPNGYNTGKSIIYHIYAWLLCLKIDNRTTSNRDFKDIYSVSVSNPPQPSQLGLVGPASEQDTSFTASNANRDESDKIRDTSLSSVNLSSVEFTNSNNTNFRVSAQASTDYSNYDDEELANAINDIHDSIHKPASTFVRSPFSEESLQYWGSSVA